MSKHFATVGRETPFVTGRNHRQNHPLQLVGGEGKEKGEREEAILKRLDKTHYERENFNDTQQWHINTWREK